MQKALDYLRDFFGYDDFRPGQREIVQAILDGRDVLAVMPTGAGKSLCFQIPALCLDGLALVVSPLVALMNEQVLGLTSRGIAAAYLNSTLTPRQQGLVLQRAALGRYRLLYVSPERLGSPDFAAFAQTCPFSLVAVDEAHCVAQWGRDFRPAYLGIGAFVEGLPSRPPVAAFTASATIRVRECVRQSLRLRQPLCLCTGFDRPNLLLETRLVTDKDAALLTWLDGHREESGFVYCSTRKEAENTCRLLRKEGHDAGLYHAGLSTEERDRSQRAFQRGEISVMVATSAFGMGIDRSDTRFVVHHSPTMDLESYYQEAGRAGRDGFPATCLLLYDRKDFDRLRYRVAQRKEDPDAGERFEALVRYATGSDCLRHSLLAYFGEDALLRCGACSRCLQPLETEVTKDLRLLLTLVKKEKGRVSRAGLVAAAQRETAFREMKDREIQNRINMLVRKGYLRLWLVPEPTFQLHRSAEKVLNGQERVYMVVGETPEERNARLLAQALYRRLLALREDLAREEGKPPQRLLPDETLYALATKPPKAREALFCVPGLGRRKALLYGDALLRCLQAP